MNYHGLLPSRGFCLGLEDHLDYIDKLYRRQFLITLFLQVWLACEKGSYSMFEGSDWQRGETFVVVGLAIEETGQR